MFRFTIRDVLWLTAVVAMALAWWLHSARLQAVQQKRLNEIATYMNDAHDIKVNYQGNDTIFTVRPRPTKPSAPDPESNESVRGVISQ